MSQTYKNDQDLSLFSVAMTILVKASELKYDVFCKNHQVRSIGVQGYGTIDTLERLAGALNLQGYRTKTGKYIRADYLKKIKSNLIKKYGRDFVTDIVEWKDVSVFPLDDALMEEQTAREMNEFNAVSSAPKQQYQKSYYEWWCERFYIDPDTDRIESYERDARMKQSLDASLGVCAA